MRRNVKVILAAVLVLTGIFCLVSVAMANDFSLRNGISFGMTPEQVMDIERENGALYNKHKLVEDTILGEPFTYIRYLYADNNLRFDNGRFSDEKDLARAEARLMSWYFDIEMDAYFGGGKDEYVLKEEDGQKNLTQVYCAFTSDSKYNDAIETFDKVEKILNDQYGVTRFTSRRNEKIIPVKGYTEEYGNVPPVSQDTKAYAFPHYSQRVLNCGEYFVAIDHHILVSDNTFYHEVVFSYCPNDISDGYSVLCTGALK